MTSRPAGEQMADVGPGNPVFARPVASGLEASPRDGGLDHEVARGMAPRASAAGGLRPAAATRAWAPWPRPPRPGRPGSACPDSSGGWRGCSTIGATSAVAFDPGQEFIGVVDVVPGAVGHDQVEFVPPDVGIGPDLGVEAAIPTSARARRSRGQSGRRSGYWDETATARRGRPGVTIRREESGRPPDGPARSGAAPEPLRRIAAQPGGSGCGIGIPKAD